MLRRHLSQLVMITGLAFGWALIASACGGSSTNSSPTTSSGASNTTSTSGTSPATATAGTQYATAGPELSAYHLLDAAGYASALGEPVTAIEDDGVVPASFGCEWGQARVLTGAGVILTVGLHTAANTNDAGQVYDSLARFGGTPTPITGGADQGGYEPGLAVVRKGAQVLQVSAQPGPTGQTQLDNIKIAGGDPGPAFATMQATAGRAAPTLAGKMSGQPCSGPALGVPAGALPPCPGNVSDLETALGITGVTATPRISDQTSFQQCDYDLGADGTVSLYTATGKQLQAAAPPLVAGDIFAKAQASATSSSGGGTYETFSNTQFMMFGSTSIKLGIDTHLLFQPSGINSQNIGTSGIQAVSYFGTPVPTLQTLIMDFLQGSSSIRRLTPDRCARLANFLITNVMNEYVADDRTVALVIEDYNAARQKAKDWCLKAVPTPTP